MTDAVRAELEQVEQLAVRAATVHEEVRDQALAAAGAHAGAALATLVHLGMITPEEDREWRERLAPALGDRLRLVRYEISKAGEESSEPDAADQARHAYLVCRDLSLSRLAWSHHTAANEEAIVAALASDARDPDRVRRACRRGFEDRGKAVASMDDL